MDFVNLLNNKNFSTVTRQVMAGSRPVTQQEKPKPQERHSADTVEKTKEVQTYRVVSSSGKEFNRRRKQSANEFYNMTNDQLLSAYDDADKTGDDKKRKRVLYYVRKRGVKVRQLRRKLNGSE
jgi:hypothetical protein